MENLDELVDKPFRGKTAKELLEAPVSALLGVSKGDEEKLIAALSIRTIGDLATHWSVLRAQAIVKHHEEGITLNPNEVTDEATDEDTDDGPDTSVWGDPLNELLLGSVDSIPLRGAWVNLQVYAYHNLGLPTDKDGLVVQYGLDSQDDLAVLTEPVINKIITAYLGLNDAAVEFLNNIYDKIVDLGNDLKAFAADIEDESENSIFQNILDFLDQDNFDDALQLLQDRIDQAGEYANAAVAIKSKLSEFKTTLINNKSTLTEARTLIENNEATKKERIDDILGDASNPESLAYLLNQLDAAQDKYSHDRAVAATTVTYAWLNVPPLFFGLIAASVVAGVYGKRATDDLAKIDQLKNQIENEEKELKTALAVQKLQHAAELGVDQNITYTAQAISSTTILQNSWNTLQSDLQTISDKLDAATTKGEEEQENAKALIKVYVTNAKTAWGDLLPDLNILMDNAYIDVDPNGQDWSDFQNKVEEYAG